MAYSFSSTGTTRDQVAADIDAQLAAIAAAQPVHDLDRAAIHQAAAAFLAALANDDGSEFSISLTGRATCDETGLRIVSFNLSARSLNLAEG